MIRRDYILRMVEEFIQAIAQINFFKNKGRWSEASASLEEQFQRLMGEGASGVTRLSETELMARLVREGPTQAVQTKTLFLTTLLKEAGDIAAAQERLEEGRQCYLKALHLLLNALARQDDFQCPAFVPKVEMLRSALQEAALPVQTRALLMEHYERIGEFARAEDELFAWIETAPDSEAIAGFGVAFYRRLLQQNDAALEAGGLPRAEVEEGLAELKNRLDSIS